MIMITIIILYFIQIRHPDDFPSTGTHLVIISFIWPKKLNTRKAAKRIIL